MRHVFLALAIGLAATACGGNAATSPVAPAAAPAAASLTGTWSGSSTDTTGAETVSWTCTQDGNNVTGTMGFGDSARSMMGNGTMRGTVNGRTLTFHMDVPSGGFGGMMSACAMSADGVVTMSDDGHTMTGTYTGNMSGMMSGSMMNQSCGGLMNNGRLTLTR